MADNPIVYVTEPWQTMCGFTYEEACGQNPRIVQGERTDQKVVRAISGALANQSACKVQFVNYRRGAHPPTDRLERTYFTPRRHPR